MKHKCDKCDHMHDGHMKSEKGHMEKHHEKHMPKKKPKHKKK